MMAQKMILVTPEKYRTLTEPTAQMEENALDVDVILSAIPKNYRNRARSLLNHIMADPQRRLRWNGRGELIYGGARIPGSHITDLLKHSQRPYQHRQPIGQSEFVRGLKELNIPAGLTTTVDPQASQ